MPIDPAASEDLVAAQAAANAETASRAQSSHDELLAQYLELHDEKCPSCAYNLRRLRTTRCPECGFALRIMIGPAHWASGCFLVGFAGLASAFGFSALTLIWIMTIVAVEGPGPAAWAYFGLAASALLSAGLMFAWARLWARFEGASRPAREALAAAAWLLPIGCVVLFLALLFTM